MGYFFTGGAWLVPAFSTHHPACSLTSMRVF